MSSLPRACPHRPACPGCPRYGDERIDPVVLDQLTAFCRTAGAPDPSVHVAPAVGYRHRVRLAVRGRVTCPKIGIFRQGTHEVVDLPRCPIHHPLVNRVATALKRCVVATRTPTYSETAHAGLIRYLQVVVERSTQRAQVVVVANTEHAETVAPLLDALQNELGPALHSLHFNGNPATTNTILGPIWQHVSGPDLVEERIGGARIFYPPDAFGQSHLGLADRAVARVHELCARAERMVEFYAGVGAIGLGLVERSREVVFNEVGSGSLRGLRRGIDELGSRLRSRVQVREGPAGAAVEVIDPDDTVIVDPPRKGLDPALLDRLQTVRARRLVYLSCHLPSFLRDAHTLGAAGYRMVTCDAFGFLPFTSHVETLASFE
jgi:23S rRNA (uracil1939-C5)-methyltransferase